MMTKNNWRSLLSFSERLGNISQIAKACQSVSGAGDWVPPEPATVEEEALRYAISKEDYRERCQKAVDELLNKDQLSDEFNLLKHDHPVDIPDEPPEGRVARKIGPYEKAVYYREGLCSVVYHAQDESGKAVALKVTTPHLMSPPHNSRREARILKSTPHRNILELLDSFSDPEARFILVFPFMPVQLDTLLHSNALSTQQIRLFLGDMFRALAQIHSMGIVHRDIKPSNILLRSSKGPAYLADFGIAWSPTDLESEPATRKITDVGTTCYRAPELLFGDSSYGPAIDIWAAGCVVSEAADRQHRQLFEPGPLGTDLSLIHSIFTTLGTPTLQTWPTVIQLPDWGKVQFKEYPGKAWQEIMDDPMSAEARDMVSKLVRYDSDRRMTADEALRHPFLAGVHP